jgi:protein dithiol oxidoreductase (disulfide-forming)
MRGFSRSYLSLCLCFALVLSGCGRQQSSSEHTQSSSPPTAALAPPPSTAAPVATTSEQQAAGLVPTQPTKVRRPNEDGSETVEDTTGDTGSHNPLLAAVASTMAAATPAATAAVTNGPALWQEGVNYTRLVPGQPTYVPAGQVEVLEFFWYGCPHCYAIDSAVESWRKSKPAYITFVRVPVMWSEGHRSTARLYYTLESMGKIEQLHGEIFKEIHVNNDQLIASDPNDVAGAERVQTAFVKKFGISEDAFKKAYHSLPVETSLQRADELSQRYRIEGVPTFVVNGKFVADVRSAGGPEKLLSLVGDLAAQEHKH